jgi:20S proteasome alpha/beta subunit
MIRAFLFRWQFDGFQKASKELFNHKKGTTTLSFIFDKGVIVAADSRASMGGYICECPLARPFSLPWSRAPVLGFGAG